MVYDSFDLIITIRLPLCAASLCHGDQTFEFVFIPWFSVA